MPWVRFWPSDWLAGTRGMSAAETGVYITLIAMMYERGEPIADDPARLARLCGTSNSHFKKALADLIEHGKIVQTDVGLWNTRVGKETVYRSEKQAVGKQNAERRWQKTERNQREAHATAVPRQCDSNANPEARVREDTDVSSTRARTPAPARRKPFDEWWSRYPHKVGKRDAEKAYASAIKRGASPDELAIGIDRYIATKPPDRPWCNPATWLNQDRWADEPAPSPSRTLNGGRNGFGRPSPADTTRGILDAIDRRRAERRGLEHSGPTIDGMAERRG